LACHRSGSRSRTDAQARQGHIAISETENQTPAFCRFSRLSSLVFD
jgi:hypothetical protein